MKVSIINQQFLMTLADCKLGTIKLHLLTESRWLQYIAVIVSRLTDYDEKTHLYEVEP